MEKEREEARRLFENRLREGLQMNPPFKGFGIALLWFAMDEPELFKLLLQSEGPVESFRDYIDRFVGLKKECVDAIRASAGLQEPEAETLYYETLMVGMGLAVIEGFFRCSCEPSVVCNP